MKGTPNTNVLQVALSDDQMVLFARATVQAMLDNIMRGGVPAEVPTPAVGAVPKIGEVWAGKGGIYAGTVRGDEGQPDYHLILAEENPEDRMTWNAGMEWAQKLTADGHSDFTLPKRKEQAVLFGNLKDRFEQAWHWSCEQHSSLPDFAWGQDFRAGLQLYDRKDGYYRVRAVRRLVIQ